MSEVRQIWIATPYSDKPRGPFDVFKETPSKWFYRFATLFDGTLIERQVFKDGRGHERPFFSEADALSFLADMRSERNKEEAKRLAEKHGPELLEALEGILSWRDDADNLHKPLEVRAAYMRARAAIARAKGGE